MSRPHSIVVGGTRGLGLVVVVRLLTRGFDVSIMSRSPSARHAENPRVRHSAVDLEVADSLDGIWRKACEGWGPISYLFLCQRFRDQGNPWEGELQVGLTASRCLIEGFPDCFAGGGDRAIGVVSSVYAQFVG